MDEEGNSTQELFKIWALPDPKQCYIRRSYFYERWNIAWKDTLGMGVDLGNGLPAKKEGSAFDKLEYRKAIQGVFGKK